MNVYGKNSVRLAACDQPDPRAHFEQRVDSLCGRIQQVFVRDESSGLRQKNDRRPAKSKVSLLLASFYRSALVGLNNTADGQCADFDLKHATENFIGKQADHALVSKARRAAGQCDWMYRVQTTPNTYRFGRLTVGREMKTVIVAGREANDKTRTRLESIQTPSKFTDIHSAALNIEAALWHIGKCQHSTLSGCKQMERALIDRSCFGFELAGEKCVERTVGGSGKFRFGLVDSELTNEGWNFASAHRRSLQQSGETTKPLSLNESVQKCISPTCFVKKTKRSLAVHPLSSELSGFPLNIGGLIARERHTLNSQSSGQFDRTIDSNVEYSIAAIDPLSPEFHDFVQFPHVCSLNFRAPPAADVIRQLGADSLFYRHGETRLFGCYRNDQLIGRVVASVDHNLPDQDVGHFGYFEAVPDIVCARMLMQACEQWIREKGKKRMEGPVNLNMLAGYRVQTAGFDTEAFPGEPRNPSYYADLLSASGYREVSRWQSWDISPLALLGLRAVDWLQRSRRRTTRAQGYRLEALRTDCLEKEARKIHYLVHEIFADNYGFSAVDLAEHLQMQGAALDGSVNVAGAFLYHSTTSKPVGFSYGFYRDRTAIFHTFGVAKAHRGTGAADLLFHQGLDEIRSQGVTRAIGALAKAGKSKYERVGRPRRAYAIVGKVLL